MTGPLPAPRPAAAGTHPERARSALDAVTAALPHTSLDDVLAVAALQTRVDRKYLVPAEDLPRLGCALAGTHRVLQIGNRRVFGYESVYFDTDGLALYRQHLQGRRRRYKVRTRTYLDTDATMFEVKLKGRRGQTVKQRLPYAVADRHVISPRARAFLDALLMAEYGEHAPELGASVTTTYSRATLVDLAGGSRLTLDVDLVCTGRTRRAAPDGHVLVETKAVGRGGPADRVLAGLGLRALSVSKYCVGVALLHPDLPANPWHRTLCRHFGYAGAEG